MALTRLATVNDIMNRAAAECGLEPKENPFGSSDPNFIKLRYLLLTAGEELLMVYPWEFLVNSHQIITQGTDDGDYPLPDDFAYMLDQTGWERNNNIPLGGPLTAQDWTYLKGRDLAQNTLYASFRIQDGVFTVFPDPPIAGLDINFEYISKNWVRSAQDPSVNVDDLTDGSDTPLYDRMLLTRLLKAKWLESAGFDSSKAQADFELSLAMLTGKDKGGKILNAGGGRGGYRYLNAWDNVGDTGFGR